MAVPNSGVSASIGLVRDIGDHDRGPGPVMCACVFVVFIICFKKSMLSNVVLPTALQLRRMGHVTPNRILRPLGPSTLVALVENPERSGRSISVYVSALHLFANRPSRKLTNARDRVLCCEIVRHSALELLV